MLTVPSRLYSKAAELASQLQRPSGSVEQMMNDLRNSKGVKGTELENAGMPAGDTITREQLQQHFASRIPDVRHIVQNPHDDHTQFSEYVAPGDSDEYREHLLQFNPGMSPAERHLRNRMEEYRVGAAKAISNGDVEGMRDFRGKHADVHNELSKYVGEDAPQYLQFDDSHWRHPNILSHFRATDRPGKTLNIEEIQSDWGQKARAAKIEEARNLEEAGKDPKKATGFYDPSALHQVRVEINHSNKEYDRHLDKMGEAEDAMNAAQDRFYNVKQDLSLAGIDPDDWENHPDHADAKDDYLQAKKHFEQLNAEYDIHDERMRTLGRTYKRLNQEADGKLPAAPYVGNTQHWLDLTLKHIMKEAVDGDYDRVSFNPGQANVEMYPSLAEHYEGVRYHPENGYFDVRKKGKPDWIPMFHNVNDRAVREQIGDELTAKLKQQPQQGGFHVLEGLDLNTKGDGMRSFYDKIVPKAVLSMVRQHDPDVQPEPYFLGNSEKTGEPFHGFSIPITDKIKKGFSGMIPAFADGGVVDLGEKREEKKLQGFHKNLMDEVREGAKERVKKVQELREAGKLPFDVGTRFHSKHTREKGQAPYKVLGHYYQPKTGAYGYHIEQDSPDGTMQTMLAVHDPKIEARMGTDRFNEHIASYQPLGGPMGIARARGGRVIRVPGTGVHIHTRDINGRGEKVLHIDSIHNMDMPPIPPKSDHWTRTAEDNILRGPRT